MLYGLFNKVGESSVNSSNDKIIDIPFSVFQYPKRKVYIRDSYITLWKYFKKVIEINKNTEGKESKEDKEEDIEVPKDTDLNDILNYSKSQLTELYNDRERKIISLYVEKYKSKIRDIQNSNLSDIKEFEGKYRSLNTVIDDFQTEKLKNRKVLEFRYKESEEIQKLREGLAKEQNEVDKGKDVKMSLNLIDYKVNKKKNEIQEKLINEIEKTFQNITDEFVREMDEEIIQLKRKLEENILDINEKEEIDNEEEYYKNKKMELIVLGRKLIEQIILYPKYFLLRGNPGLGKTSFIIYLLHMLKEYSYEENDLKKSRLKIYVCKNIETKQCIRYEYKDGKLEPVNSLPRTMDIIISDSFDLDLECKTVLFCLYVSSPDQKSYNSFINYDGAKENLYLDVFSDEEIEEWKKYCLPKDLSDYISKNDLAKKYGNVPRHIYFAAIGGVYYNRDYWKEMYCKGIDTVVGDCGFVNFLQKYILPCDPYCQDRKEISTMNVFDSTLCHYIIKYSYNNIFEINKYEMGFISGDVVDYIMNGIHHVSSIKEAILIKKLFNKIKINVDQHPLLYSMLFQELSWCKLMFVRNDIENEINK